MILNRTNTDITISKPGFCIVLVKHQARIIQVMFAVTVDVGRNLCHLTQTCGTKNTDEQETDVQKGADITSKNDQI